MVLGSIRTNIGFDFALQARLTAANFIHSAYHTHIHTRTAAAPAKINGQIPSPQSIQYTSIDKRIFIPDNMHVPAQKLLLAMKDIVIYTAPAR